MHIKYCKYFITILCVTLMLCSTANAADRELSLVSSSDGSDSLLIKSGDPISVDVKIDNADIAGASFTITYDTSNLTLDSVTSNFFQTFVQQLDPDPDPACVTVDTTEYCSPIVENVVTTGSMIAAARVDNGSGSDVTTFTLNFSLVSGGNTGASYPVGITQSIIDNEDAGYDPAGEVIPYLVYIDDSDPTDPYKTHDVPSPLGCTIAFDMDGDDIADWWEVLHRPDGVPITDPNILTYFSKTGDYDKDGYSDYQEYFNGVVNGENDPEGGAYDPKVKNAPGGTGYVKPKNGLVPVYNILLLD